MLALAALTMLMSTKAFSYETKYYYRTDASVSTGEGTVYASNDFVEPSNTVYQASSTTGTGEDSISYVFAKPAKGYAFESWTLASGELDTASYKLTSNPAMLINAGKSSANNNPAVLSLKANFVPAVVSVKSENSVLGSASISKLANTKNDIVALTASPSKNIFKASESYVL